MKFKKLLGVVCAAALAATSLPTTLHAEEATALTVCTDAAGLEASKINNPTQGQDYWEGATVYFGRFGAYPVLFRVLQKGGEFGENNLLMDSYFSMFRYQYSRKGDANWDNSSLKAYLNGDFMLSSFSDSERKAMLSVNASGLTGEKVFLLSPEEASNAAYGLGTEGSREKLTVKYSSNTPDPYVLRSSGDSLSILDSNGEITTGNPDDLNWVSPAIVLKGENILFTWPAVAGKPDRFSIVDHEPCDLLVLTLLGGSGFAATRTDNNPVPAGHGFVVNVSDLGQPDWSVTYTQISGMLLDETGRIIAYGPISETAATGDCLVKIPDGVPDGKYTIRIFAEDINSNDFTGTDYASNPIDLSVTVGAHDGIQSETTVNPAQSTTNNETEKTVDPSITVEKDTKPAETQPAPAATTQQTSNDPVSANAGNEATTPAQNAPKAHKITAQVQGKGKCEASAQTATVGTIVSMKAVPEAGWHLKAWSSKEVLPTADGRITMPDRDVTVTAIFEQDAARKYKVTVSQDVKGGNITVDKVEAAAGEKVQITQNAQNGWKFKSWNIPGVATDAEGKYFLMPAADVVVSALFTQNHKLTLTTKGQGTVEAKPANPNPGEKVTLTAKPYAGYHFKKWVSDEVTPGSSNKFVMPDMDVTVKAVFEEDVPEMYVVMCETNGSGVGNIALPYGTVYQPGDKVIVDVSHSNGSYCSSLTVKMGGKTKYLDTEGDFFIMPQSSVTVTATFDIVPSPEPVYYDEPTYYEDPDPGYYDSSYESGGYIDDPYDTGGYDEAGDDYNYYYDDEY